MLVLAGGEGQGGVFTRSQPGSSLSFEEEELLVRGAKDEREQLNC